MTLHLDLTDIQKIRRSLSRVLCERDDDQATAPIKAGMRARAISDACEMLGLGAVLVDATGTVLHVGVVAASMLRDDLRVASGHLVGSSRAVNQAVQRAMATAIGMTDLDDADIGVEAAGLTITGLPYLDPSPFQLLRGVLVIGRDSEWSGVGLKSLQELLAA